jgi:hypothetical protein
MNWRCAILIVLAAPFQAPAQSSTTYQYLFPIFAAGTSGGITYKSALRILNVDAANPALGCTLTQRGTDTAFTGIHGDQYYSEVFNSGDDAAALTTIQLDRYLPWEALTSTRKTVLQGGYASLTCSRAVAAGVQISLFDAAGAKFGETTVLPAALAASFEFLINRRDGTRLGVALVNDSQAEGEYTIIARDEFNQEVDRAYDTMEAWSHVSRFVDEMLKLPANFAGTVEVVGVNGGRNYAVGLQYTGAVFSTVPPLVRSTPRGF